MTKLPRSWAQGELPASVVVSRLPTVLLWAFFGMGREKSQCVIFFATPDLSG